MVNAIVLYGGYLITSRHSVYGKIWSNKPVYLDVYCTSTSSMVQLDSNPVPKILILLQTVVHTHRSDSAAFPF